MTTKTELKMQQTAYRVSHLTPEQRAELAEYNQQIVEGLRKKRGRDKTNLGEYGANELIMALGVLFRKHEVK